MSCPNPLYHSWLSEWLEEENTRNQSSQRPLYVYKKALRGMTQYPHPIQQPEQTQRVSGIGATIAARIKAKLNKYLEEGGKMEDVWGGQIPSK